MPSHKELNLKLQENNMTNSAKLNALRDYIKKNGISGYIVPRTDEYLGEYVPANAERLSWLTGFTGSAGAAVVMLDKAVVMSDGRYTLQLAEQVDASLYELVNSQETSLSEWLKAIVKQGDVIGYDPKLHTSDEIKKIEEAGVTLMAIKGNLIDVIWADRPAAPMTQVTLFDEKYAGQSAQDKIKSIQEQLTADKVEAVLITMSDSIAWALNIRGGDIPFIPVCLSYLIIPATGKVQWFVQDKKITIVKKALGDIVEFLDEDEIAVNLLKFKSVQIDEKRTPIYFKNILQENSIDILNKEDPVILPRACKNQAEQAAMKQAHIRDGVALVKFLKWFDVQAQYGQLSELSVEAKLENFRAQALEFKEPSFSTIAGFGAHGAIVHYRASEESNLTITTNDLLLLDSGAQYNDGTTDITRTILIGDVADEVKENYTLVLKGHIGIASAVFKKGSVGKDIDGFARAPLQSKGLDYSHGTGHGVGCYLSVHEEAASISPRGERALEAGMIISNEPGYYKQGTYGIRIENLVLVTEHDAENLCFETITLAPIDKSLIVKEMMSEDELEWFNDYHARVYKTLSPLLDDAHQAWLKVATSAI